ncbi:MAG: NAD(P)-dependent oxidoreductase [Armatimonadetes bacterium]|nr:NAD(P)-dependent oxidoreductase [Armatimonadota bacterium]
MSETAGFVGLGQMGQAMARNLLKAGFRLRVYNRTAERAEPLARLGAARAAQPGETVPPGGIVFTMLTNDQAVGDVAQGEHGLLNALGEGGVHVSMSTIAPDTARWLARRHEERGQHYVAAPVFGKPDAAAAAKLWIATSGPADAKERARPFLEAMGQGIYDFGDDPGAAHVVKLTGNFLFGAAIEAMAEAYTLAQKNGISRQKVHDLFTDTLFACPAYKGYGRLIAAQRYEPVGAPPSLIRKDFRLVRELADRSETPMPLADLIHQRLTATVAKGRDDRDWAGFAQEASDDAGL